MWNPFKIKYTLQARKMRKALNEHYKEHPEACPTEEQIRKAEEALDRKGK